MIDVSDVGMVYLCLVDTEVFVLLRETRATAAAAGHSNADGALEEHHSHLQPEVSNAYFVLSVSSLQTSVNVLSIYLLKLNVTRPIDFSPSKNQSK